MGSTPSKTQSSSKLRHQDKKLICKADSRVFPKVDRPKESGSPAKGQEWSGMHGVWIKCAVQGKPWTTILSAEDRQGSAPLLVTEHKATEECVAKAMRRNTPKTTETNYLDLQVVMLTLRSRTSCNPTWDMSTLQSHPHGAMHKSQ